LNGSKWTLGPAITPNWGGGITGSSGDAADDVWVVGSYCTSGCPGFLTRNLIVHYNRGLV
jgi:hypothetical protein